MDSFAAVISSDESNNGDSSDISTSQQSESSTSDQSTVTPGPAKTNKKWSEAHDHTVPLKKQKNNDGTESDIRKCLHCTKEFNFKSTSACLRHLCKKMCEQVCIPFLSYPPFVPENYLNDHVKTLAINSNGNCLFATLVRVIGGSHHPKYDALMRQQVVRHMKTPSIKDMLEKQFNVGLETYISSTGVDKVGVWGSTIQILGAASLLKIDICMLIEDADGSKLWSVCPADIKGCERTDHAVFIINKNSHYEPIIALANL